MSTPSGFIPGRQGLIPADKAAFIKEAKRQRKIARKRQRSDQRARRTVAAYTRAVWWGFPADTHPNRALRRAMKSRKLAGPYSQVIIQDAYGEDIDRNSPADMEFAQKVFRPSTGKKSKYHKPKALLEVSDLMRGLLINGEFDGWDTRTA